MKKIKDIVKESSTTGGSSAPPDSGPNTFVQASRYKKINDLFAEKLGMKILKLLADSDMIDIVSGDRMGNKLAIDDKISDFNEFNSDMAKKLGFTIANLLNKGD